MSARRGEWISKRGQLDVATAIDQVLERQPDEQVHQLDDTQIEDSPYQARRPFNDASVEDLAQGMREIGFQGVLIVRPHGEPLMQRRGLYQLVYGHRRRAAWRRVCAERGERCLLPVVIREVSDERMLTIGAQENLQREDLDPVEEAQIVAWHQRMFSDKNQSEIGAMLGKSSDWVSMRARIHKLPEALKERLRLRPRAVSQILEVGSLAAERPDEALRLADRIVAENLTLEAVRHMLRGYARPEQPGVPHRDETHNRRGAATIVQKGTSGERLGTIPKPATDVQESPLAQRASDIGTTDPSQEQMAGDMPLVAPTGMYDTISELDQLQAVAATLTVIAGRASTFTSNSSIMHSLDQSEHALGQIRSVLTRAALGPNSIAPRHYQLAETNLSDMLVALIRQRPSLVTVQHGQRLEMTLHLICFLMPWNGARGQSTHARPNDLFIAVSGAGHGILPLIESLPVERIRNSLGLPAEGATALTALIGDLARAQAQLQ